MNDEKQPIGVVGVGWVGLVTATCFAELGHPVIALDIVEEKVEALRRGEVTIHEPGLAELLAAERRAAPVHDLDGRDARGRAGCSFCCVDTPPTYSGDADLSRVRAVVEQLPEGSAARAGDEEHRPVGHRRRDPPRQARPGAT